MLNIHSKIALKKKSVKKPTPTSPKTFLIQKGKIPQKYGKYPNLLSVLALYMNLKQAIKFIDLNFNRRTPH